MRVCFNGACSLQLCMYFDFFRMFLTSFLSLFDVRLSRRKLTQSVNPSPTVLRVGKNLKIRCKIVPRLTPASWGFAVLVTKML